MNNPTKDTEMSTKRSGILYGLLAYIVWGFLPIYWKLLDILPAIELLAQRIFWSFFFMLFLVFYTKRWDEFKSIFRNSKKMKSLFISTTLITINWFIYIWAINSDRIVEASLGYFITPIISFLLGMIVFGEKLEKKQYIAILLTIVGVAVLTFQYGKFPYVSLALALSFGLYGFMKKFTGIDSTIALTVETTILMPIIVLYIIYRQAMGIGVLGNASLLTTTLVLGTGIVTAVPLIWYSISAIKLDLSTLGFLQFFSPTISLIIGVLIYGEPFTQIHLISFSFIWAALALYSIPTSLFKRKSAEIAAGK